MDRIKDFDTDEYAIFCDIFPHGRETTVAATFFHWVDLAALHCKVNAIYEKLLSVGLHDEIDSVRVRTSLEIMEVFCYEDTCERIFSDKVVSTWMSDMNIAPPIAPECLHREYKKVYILPKKVFLKGVREHSQCLDNGPLYISPLNSNREEYRVDIHAIWDGSEVEGDGSDQIFTITGSQLRAAVDYFRSVHAQYVSSEFSKKLEQREFE